MINKHQNFRTVTKEHPCRICGKGGWCRTNDDTVYCKRVYDLNLGYPCYEEKDKNGDPYYVYRIAGGETPQHYAPKYSLEDGKGELADPDVLNLVYQFLLNSLALNELHQEALLKRGLSMERIIANGYKTLDKSRSKAVRALIRDNLEHHLPRTPGFYVKTANNGQKYWSIGGENGLLIPVRDTEGRIIALQIRPDEQSTGQKYKFISSAYRGGVGPGSPIHVPLHPQLSTETIRITEGYLKADIATALDGILTIGLPGINSIERVPSILEVLRAREILIALDADACTNSNVARGLKRLTTLLMEG